MSEATVQSSNSQAFAFTAQAFNSLSGQQLALPSGQEQPVNQDEQQLKSGLPASRVNGQLQQPDLASDSADPLAFLDDPNFTVGSENGNSDYRNSAPDTAGNDNQSAGHAAAADIGAIDMDCLVSDECDPSQFLFAESANPTVDEAVDDGFNADNDENGDSSIDEDDELDNEEDGLAGLAEDLLPAGVDQNELIKAAAKEARDNRRQGANAPAAEDGASPTKQRAKTQFERRNIRRIRDAKVDEATLVAQQAELERRRRIQEKQQQAAAAAAKASSTLEALFQTDEDWKKQKASAMMKPDKDEAEADEDDDACCIVEPPPAKRSKTSSPDFLKPLPLPPPPPLSSSSSNFTVGRSLLNRVPQYSSLNQLLSSRGVTGLAKQPETIVIDSDDNEEADDEEDDEENATDADKDTDGKHVKDEQNVPDGSGRVLVNVSHPAEDPDIFLTGRIAKAIRPHQIGGVRFLYDNVVENLQLFANTPGFGCILAHSMGLGKTLQVCAFCHALFNGVNVKSVLIIVPINTIQNWVAEFNHWLPADESACPDESDRRKFALHVISDSCKTMTARHRVISQWRDGGGVLLLGYEMFRLLLQKRYRAGGGGGGSRSMSRKSNSSASLQSQSKPDPDPIVIDVDKEDEALTMWEEVRSALVDPGPQVVICDEGHRIKNSAAGISKALKNLKTKRRVVMTGYPLQNNLLEYWCMVDFVRPNFLGTKQQFSNMFERPITNGQCIDSTQSDRKLMRYRAHVLHELLSGFVQRRSHSVLQKSLPPKTEFVLLLRMSPIQEALYARFMQSLQTDTLSGWAAANPLKAFAVGCKIWNHPDILHHLLMAKSSNLAAAAADDLDIDYSLDVDAGKDSVGGSLPAVSSEASLAESVASSSSASTATTASKKRPGRRSAAQQRSDNSDLFSNAGSIANTDNAVLSLDWAEEIMKNYTPNLLKNGAKIVVFQRILNECISRNDRLLVFSQSLFTLDLLEKFLRTWPIDPNESSAVEETAKWCKGVSYFRLDGSTAASEREKMINSFNSADSPAKLFLLSTRAGCLGINLIGANRVVVMDASWNPCHDCQAVCRVYRYGQTKPCYIYRLITDNTMERKIYDRQVSKQSVADRIVDEMNPNCQFTRQQVMLLMDYRPTDPELQPPSDEAVQAAIKESPDFMLEQILLGNGAEAAPDSNSESRGISRVLTKPPFTHESLLLDRQEARLTRAEKRKAREYYERDKMTCGLSARQSLRDNYSMQYVAPNSASSGSGSTGPIVDLRAFPSFYKSSSMGSYGSGSHLNRFINSGGQLTAPNRFGSFAMHQQQQQQQQQQYERREAFLRSMQQQGFNIEHIVVTTDITVCSKPPPGVNTIDGKPVQSRIPAGTPVTMLKSATASYMQLPNGKMYAVRPKSSVAQSSQSSSSSTSISTSTSTSISTSMSTATSMSTVFSRPVAAGAYSKLPHHSKPQQQQQQPPEVTSSVTSSVTSNSGGVGAGLPARQLSQSDIQAIAATNAQIEQFAAKMAAAKGKPRPATLSVPSSYQQPPPAPPPAPTAPNVSPSSAQQQQPPEQPNKMPVKVGQTQPTPPQTAAVASLSGPGHSVESFIDDFVRSISEMDSPEAENRLAQALSSSGISRWSAAPSPKTPASAGAAVASPRTPSSSTGQQQQQQKQQKSNSKKSHKKKQPAAPAAAPPPAPPPPPLPPPQQPAVNQQQQQQFMQPQHYQHPHQQGYSMMQPSPSPQSQQQMPSPMLVPSPQHQSVYHQQQQHHQQQQLPWQHQPQHPASQSMNWSPQQQQQQYPANQYAPQHQYPVAYGNSNNSALANLHNHTHQGQAGFSEFDPFSSGPQPISQVPQQQYQQQQQQQQPASLDTNSSSHALPDDLLDSISGLDADWGVNLLMSGGGGGDSGLPSFDSTFNKPF